MACIDKLYVKSYFEYDNLRKWAIAYYPQLLCYFYDITLDYDKWRANVSSWVENQKEILSRDLALIDNEEDLRIAPFNLIRFYKNSANYDCPYERAEDEVKSIFKRKELIETDQIENEYATPVMNTPIEVDRILLWTCPLPCVRRYLEGMCGYKTRWYHKIFWRGKRHF